jgi:hypothetical protein
MYGKPAMTCSKYQVYLYGSHIWMLSLLFFEGLQSRHSESSDSPHPSLLAAIPLLYGSITFIHLKENSSIWLNYQTFVKKQNRENLYGWGPSRVKLKQLTLNHMCKIGLSKEMRKIAASVTLHIFTHLCTEYC